MARTEGSATFAPDTFFDTWARGQITPPYDNDFRRFILRAFGLSPSDAFVYRASTEVTLLQVQTYTEFGAQGGLHAWYRDANDEIRPPPPASDIAAYTDLFRPTTNTAKALTALASNAKKESIRAEVATHLTSLYHAPEASRRLAVPKSKTHVNPYFDVWAWSNQNLEWGGPESRTAQVKISHAILPVLYHHFGCVCPSYEALSLIQQITNNREILDIGSGNGYWTYMLRRFETNPKKKTMTVTAIDNGLSEWRTMWIDDTVVTDGAKWLQQHKGGEDAVLLLVYPMVGNDFTSSMLRAYRGTTIICAGAQNASGFTAFAKETITAWMAREMPTWARVLQIPLPSFAGKDEALFVFEKPFR